METPELSEVTGRMDGFRRRIRSLYLLCGLFRVCLAVVALLIVSFLLDLALQLPLPVRYASCLIAIVAVGVVVLRTIVYPLSVRITDDDLALAAEARVPLLRDRLISALQFKRQIDDPDNAESKVMMRAVIDEAASLSRAVEVRKLTDGRPVRRSGALAGATTLVFLLLVLALPGPAGVWAKRNLLLMDIPWPRSTTIRVRGFPESGELVVTRGETVRIEAVAEGRVPNDVRIGYVRNEGNDDPVYRPMFEDEAAPGVFRFEFRQVPASFDFWVNGGDDDDDRPVYSVRALVPPTIEKIEASCVFPDYTGMPPETFREGDLDLPEGTVLDLRLTLNMPLASATLTRDTREPEPLALEHDGRVATARMQIDRTFDYRIEMTGFDGQRNLPDSARFRIRSVADRKPVVRILYPSERESFTAEASLPVKVLATDNYGVSRVSLFYRVGAEGDFTERVFPAEELSAATGSREIVAYLLLPVADLTGPEGAVGIGDEIHWFAEAADNHENTDRTPRHRIEVVSAEDLERKLGQRQGALREDVIETDHEQVAALEQTVSLLDFLEREGDLAPEDRERIRDDQVLQSKVTREMDRFVDSVGRVFVAYVLNRLSTPLATERILGFFDDFLREDHEELSRVFKRELFLRIIDDYREGNIIDQEVLAILIEILDVSIGITEETSPDAHRRLAGLARGEADMDLRTSLAKIREIQQGILESFRELDRKMQRWESYAEIIQLARDLKDLQHDIRQGTDGVRKEK